MARTVIIIDNTRYHRSPQHFIDLLPAGTPARVCRATAGEFPALSGDERVILTGGETSVLEPVAWMEQELAFIRHAAGRGVPMLGVCLGHQAIAVALAGPQVLEIRDQLEVGWIDVEHRAPDPLLAGLPNPFPIFAWHFHAVHRLPAPFRVLAGNAATAVHACRYGDAPIWGLQFHPEITGPLAMEWLTQPSPYEQQVYRDLGVEVSAVADAAPRALWGRRILHTFTAFSSLQGQAPAGEK